jgi:hypothetical protein
MENTKTSRGHKILKILKWTFFILVGLYLAIGIARGFYLYFKSVAQKKTDAQVEKIHNTKLTLDDVMGKNLPPDPGALADQTVAGIDANNNGIRDDVELAIFNAYPNSAKTRAVLLQYALALQMEFIQPIINREIVTAVAEDEGSAYMCVGEVTSRADFNKFIKISDQLHSFVEDKQLNTDARKQAQKDFFNGHLDSYSDSDKTCDVDLSTLPN